MRQTERLNGKLGRQYISKFDKRIFKKNDLQLCSTSQRPVRICFYGSRRVSSNMPYKLMASYDMFYYVKKGQLGSIRSKLGSTAFMWGHKKLGESFHERNVI